MRKLVIQVTLLAILLLGLPLFGVWIAGVSVSKYLEFPPRSIYVEHASFSLFYSIACGLIFLGAVIPILIKGIRTPENRVRGTLSRRFPWWGLLGIGINLGSWVLAWSRFSWFRMIQPHTFSLLWVSFIVIVNAICYRRDGRCMMTHQPLYFFLLFPASAAFWWFFEYLNRFVQNWIYIGPLIDASSYGIFGTLSFSTVLPAVLGVKEWIYGTERIQMNFHSGYKVKALNSKIWIWVLLILSGTGLAGVGVWPNFLFPLLWISPLFMITSVQILFDEEHIFSQITDGDWRGLISAALSALLCGWFWEMWNFYSLSKWEYRIPFVQRFHVFEMPILGYAGYLPFGLECTAVGNLVKQSMDEFKKTLT
ncbi:MAG: hypothetical protein AB1659_05310 [Thermodesulfobacteriota bacterium]